MKGKGVGTVLLLAAALAAFIWFIYYTNTSGKSDPGKSDFHFVPGELEINDGEAKEISLWFALSPREVEYSVKGDSVSVEEIGDNKFNVVPQKDGKTTITAVDSGGMKAECGINVVMPRDLLSLIESGDVTVTMSSSGIQEGKIVVKNETDRRIAVRISPGTYMRASGSGYQNMLVTEPVSDILLADTTRTFVVSTCCMNMHRSIPTDKDDFSLDITDNETLQALAGYFHKNETTYSVRQAAVWIVTDGASYSDCGTLVNSAGTRVIRQSDYDKAKEIVSGILADAAPAVAAPAGAGGDTPEPESQAPHEAEGSLIKYDICGDVYEGGYYLLIPEGYYTVEKSRETGETSLYRDEDGFMMGQSAFDTADGLSEMMDIFGSSAELIPDYTDTSMTLAGHDAVRYVFYSGTEKEYIGMYFIMTDGRYAAWCFIAHGPTADSVAGEIITGVLGTLGHD